MSDWTPPPTTPADAPPPGWGPPPSTAPTDPTAPGWTPPPPPATATNQQAWGTPGWAGAPGGPDGAVQAPTGRPKAVVGGALLLAAAALLVLGTFLPWVSFHGEDVNGFGSFACHGGDCVAGNVDGSFGYDDDQIEFENPGLFTLAGAAILAGFAVTLLWAGRVVAVAILALVCSIVGLLISGGIYALAVLVTEETYLDAELGTGPLVVLVSAVVAIAASIVALAQRTPRSTAATGG